MVAELGKRKKSILMDAGTVTYVALLRGINVGGKNLVSMVALKTCFERIGFERVTTYINSGNVIFKAGQEDSRALEIRVEKALRKNFSMPIRVIIRSFADMERLIGDMPKNWQGNAGQKCNVMFLRHTIDHPSILDGLQPRPGIEEIHYRPGVLFWSAKMSAITRSNMTRLSSKPIYQDMTVRILNTACKIYKIMRAF